MSYILGKRQRLALKCQLENQKRTLSSKIVNVVTTGDIVHVGDDTTADYAPKLAGSRLC